jgi:hypothetical protein
VQFINEEAVPASSPLATQFSSINPIGKDVYVNFSTRVGQESTLYFATGNYHLYTHDNLTDSLNFTLVNETIGYDFNGPNITRETEAAFNSTNRGLIVSPVSQPYALLVGQPASFMFSAEFRNGTLLDHAQMENASVLYGITNMSGLFVGVQVAQSVSGQYLRLNFTLTVQGQFTLSVRMAYGGNSGSYSYTFPVGIPANVTSGLSLYLTPVPQVQVNVTSPFVVLISYIHGSSSVPLTSAQTLAFLANISAVQEQDGNFMGFASAYMISAGQVGIRVNASRIGTDWILSVSGGENISGSRVFGSTNTTFAVVSYNPTQPPPTTGQQILAFIETPDGIVTLALSIGIPLGVWLVRWAGKRKRTRNDEDNQTGLVMEGIAMYFGLSKQEVQAITSAIPADRRNQIMRLLTSGKMGKMVLKGIPQKNAKEGIVEEIKNEI